MRDSSIASLLATAEPGAFASARKPEALEKSYGLSLPLHDSRERTAS
jgi:hypothetical protein